MGENGTISDRRARKLRSEILPHYLHDWVVGGTFPDSSCLVSHSLPTLEVNSTMELEKIPLFA